jgi:hypothetical protein
MQARRRRGALADRVGMHVFFDMLGYKAGHKVNHNE